MSKPLARILLPSRFQVITSPQNKVVQRLERLRRSKAAREEEGHVVVQGIKTLQELGSKGHHCIRTIGVTYDMERGPIRSPALDVVMAVQREEEALRADQYVAVSRKLTTRILGTDSPTAEHEVWAEVAIPDRSTLFSTTAHLLVFDQVSDPGNMGLMIRSAKAFSWSAGWQTPGTVDPFNDKVVRASRALCLDFPIKVGGRWTELEVFLKNREIVPLVADMVPGWISQEEEKGEKSSSTTSTVVDPHRLVWWNWPSSLSRSKAPEKIALIMSSEHHGVEGRDDRLLGRAIRVSIPMNPAVESMNVAAAATAMMWELNRVLDSQVKKCKSSTREENLDLQIFDRDV
ncbi:Alpha/beta knot methyltransferase [Linnemannia elongata]|nr:Alpha/beta knot methyltransferase [Linnemannia elongata]